MFKLVQTCGACPESYDCYFEGDLVGHFRLRHGHFSVTYKYGEDVYSANPKGDGIFEYGEREHFLNMGCMAIKSAINRDREYQQELLFEICEAEDV